MPVSFEELAGSPTVRVTERETLAVRAFRVAWDDWPALARELVGSYSRVGCAFLFQPPIEFPSLPNLVVSEIEVEPFAPDSPRGELVTSLASGTNRYPDGGARVTATYRAAYDARNALRGDMPTIPSGTYLTFAGELSAETQSTPGRIWHYAVTGSPILAADTNPSVVIPTGSYRLSWHRVPAPPWDTIRSLRGKVNQATFLGAPAGTVLFLGATLTPRFPLAEAGQLWTIQYAFAERTVPLASGSGGWNHVYKEQAVSGDHWIPIADDSGNPPYRAGDFGGLFQFGSC